MIIGVTGTFSAGKDTVGVYLTEKGFLHYSLSDEIREIAKQRGTPFDQSNLVKLGNELRTRYGTGYLSRRVLKKIGKRNAVVTSIRNPGEVRELQKSGHFVLLAVDAPVELRFARAKTRGRPGDAQTLPAFIREEEKQKSASPTAQQLHKTIAMADETIQNNGNKKELYTKIDQFLKEI